MRPNKPTVARGGGPSVRRGLSMDVVLEAIRTNRHVVAESLRTVLGLDLLPLEDSVKRDQVVDDLQKALNARTGELVQVNQQLADLRGAMDTAQSAVRDGDEHVNELRAELQLAANKIADLKEALERGGLKPFNTDGNAHRRVNQHARRLLEDATAQGEPVFLLVAHDELAPGQVDSWAETAFAAGVNEQKVIDAKRVARDMRAFQKLRGCHLPDAAMR